ncbi:MAG: cytochrome P450 [Pseudomonadota bacterium]
MATSDVDRPLLDHFDLRSLPDDFYENPYPYYRALREETPVRQMPDGTLLVTRHRDLDRIYRDTTTFSSDKKIEFFPKYGESPLYDHHTTSLVFNDPPLHTRVRRAIVGALAPRALTPLEPQVAAFVGGLIRNIKPESHFDAVADFGSKIPIQIIGNLLCVPEDERDQLRDWSLAILGALEPALTEEQEREGNEAVTEFIAYLETLVARRKRDLKDEEDDILARLIRETGEGGDLLHHELLQNCIFILNAGHETTTNTISSGSLLLSQMPEIIAKLQAEPDLWPVAVEEILRLESPNQLGNRRAVAPFDIDGKTHPEGTLITLGIGAANRDPDVFEDPDTFRFDRGRNPHLAFAGGGHLCAGLTVARIEARVALSMMFEAFPGLVVDGQIVRSRRARFRGFDSLPMKAVRYPSR